MASVTYSFNLEPVASAASQRASSTAAESSDAVAAKYQAAQPSTVQSQHSMAGMQSPACDGSTCFIVHSDGPGVTTLSLGEEDGGGAGEFLTLPVVDGVQFMEPPVTSFADAGQFDITTLAIGEEDGGMASAAPEIGSTQPSFEVSDANQQFALQPMPTAKPEMTIAPQTVQTAEVQSQFASAGTTQIVEPRMKPETTAFSMAPIVYAPAATPLPPIQTTPISTPRAKPTEIAAPAAPLPEMKPATVAAAPAPMAAPTPMAAPAAPAASAVTSAPQPAAASGENFVSVGDYDSYIASLGGGEGTTTAATTGGSEAVATAEVPVAPTTTTVTYAPPPPAPVSTAVTYSPPPAAPVEAMSSAQPAPAAAMEETVAPRMKPATFTTPGPATLPPIQTVPIQSSPAVTADPIQLSPQAAPVAESTFNFATIDTPMPAGKPEGSGLDAPRLSEEDFRITTLALGEEDAGGG